MQINTTTVELLFILVFISQIILLSWYYPKKISDRINSVIEKYPPSKYPKLYLKPKSYYLKKMELFRNLVTFALITCFSIVMISWTMGNSFNEEMLIFICFMFQSIPILILGAGSAIHFKEMKKIHKTSSRKANLQPRKFFDFVSPLLASIAVILFAAFIFIYLIINDFDFTKTEVLITVIGLTLMKVGFITSLLWKVNGSKSNPLASEADRIKEIQVVAKITTYTSVGISIFLLISTIMDQNQFLDSLDPIILSFYFQLITVFGIGTEIRSVNIDDLDFDVYKNDISIRPQSTSV
jgi:hypothetical protein